MSSISLRPPSTAHCPPPTAHRPPSNGFTALLLLPLLLASTSQAASPNSMGPAGPAGPLWQYGSFEVRPHLDYTGAYEDGVLAQPGAAKNTYIDTFAPGVLFRFGPEWTLDYTPTWTWYSNPAFRDQVGHSVQATGATALMNTAIGLKHGYVYSATPLVETGRQTEIQTVTTGVTATRVLSRQLALMGTADQRLSFISSLPDFHEWIVGGMIRSQLTPRVDGGVGVRTGYAVTYKAPDMAYVQPTGEIAWKPTDKLSLLGSVAIDERVTMGRPWRWRESPIFAGTVRYEPFANTTLRGAVAQTISPSMFNAQSARITSWSGNGEQRLLGRFWVSGGISYTNTSYRTNGYETAIRRKDNTWTYDAALRTNFLRRGTITVSYRDSDNSSNLEGYAVRSKRIACSVGYRY